MDGARSRSVARALVGGAVVVPRWPARLATRSRRKAFPIVQISSIDLVLRSALLSLSKDARVSKDGHKRDRAPGHPSRRPRQERGLLRMRAEGLVSIVRCDWPHRTAVLETCRR